jgi:hypothetical protein
VSPKLTLLLYKEEGAVTACTGREKLQRLKRNFHARLITGLNAITDGTFIFLEELKRRSFENITASNYHNACFLFQIIQTSNFSKCGNALLASCVEINGEAGAWRECDFNQLQETSPCGRTNYRSSKLPNSLVR